MDPVRKKYQKALKVSEIADYLQDIKNCSDEELDNIEVAVLPPEEVDQMTDMEKCPDDIGVVQVSDLVGHLEFSCIIDNIEEDHNIPSTFPTSKTRTVRHSA